MATRILLHALIWACLLWSTTMLATRDRDPVRCLDLNDRPGYWDCHLHRRIPDPLGEIGSALPDP